ncbi:MAG: dynamin family protein [Bacteroidales bacterium]|nr:dynamin family protein [Bacteroidales bacterium]
MPNFQQFTEKLEQFFGLLNLPEKSDELKRITGTITASDFIDVAVVGQFKAGKSSFINSLLGETVIPTGFLPVTSVITRVCFGERIEIIIRHQDGMTVSIPTEKLVEFCSEQYNPGNRKKIDVIDVYHPALKEVSKIRLVDTPGLGSISEETTQVTTRWLTEASYALLIISSERPLSAADLAVVEQLKKICPRISLLITKIDLVPSEEHTRLMEYIRNGISAYSTDYPIQILGYSIFNHLSDYREPILQKIIRPLQEQFDDEKTSVSVHKLSGLSRDCLQYTEIVLRNQEKFKNDEQQLLGVVKEIEKNREQSKTELLYTTTAFKGEVRGMLEKVIIPFQDDMTHSLFSLFEAGISLQKGMLYQVSNWFEKWIIDSIRSSVNQTYPETLCQVDAFLADKAGFYTLFVKSFQQTYKQFIRELYNVEIRIEPIKVAPVQIGNPDISIYRIFNSHLDLFFFYFPVVLIKPLLRRYLMKQIEYEVEKNLRRHISILTGKILKIIDTYHKVSALAIQNELETLERLIRSKTDMEKPYLVMREELHGMIEELQNLQNKLKQHHIN